jgi:hypothetical protein
VAGSDSRVCVSDSAWTRRAGEFNCPIPSSNPRGYYHFYRMQFHHCLLITRAISIRKTGKGNATYNHAIRLPVHHDGLHEHFAACQEAFPLTQPLRRGGSDERQRNGNHPRFESKVPEAQQTLVSDSEKGT